MACNRICDVVLPGVPLSPAGSLPVLGMPVVPREEFFSEDDADPNIGVHSIHWVICIESYQSRRQLYVGTWWTLLYQDLETCLYGQGCKVILAFRGTKTTKDLYDDTLISLGQVFPRASQAVRFTSEFILLNPTVTIELTGHSLGGAIAREVGRYLQLPTVTFNSASPPSTPVLSAPGEVAYHIVFDIISAWQAPNTIRIDKGYWPIPSLWGFLVPYLWIWNVLNGILPSHSLKNFSNRRPGVVVSAQHENLSLSRWFNSLPATARTYVLLFLFGTSGNTPVSLPEVK